jgi:predicted CoA-substrate-specific enzyme activase
VKVFLGIDIGSVSTKIAALDGANELIYHSYLPTHGDPVKAIQQGLKQLAKFLPEGSDVCGVATTGSARYLAGAIVGADLVKNEITSQAIGALHYIPEVQTVIEIGGQDNKIIIIRDGIVTDFGMNTVCAAGTGSFLDHQAQRLNITIEQFSQLAMESRNPVNIAGRCTVFAESDMIHKQQTGYRIEDIAYGLCQTLVRNYLSNVGLGKDIQPPIVFQGGVAFNKGIVRAFKEELNIDIIIPTHNEILGAIGAALLAQEEKRNYESSFKGFGISEIEYSVSSLNEILLGE